MEIREAKAELKEYIDNKRYIERKQEEIERLTEQINKVTATYSDMPKGSGSSKEDLIAKKIELDNEIYRYLVELMNKRLVIERTVQQLEPEHRNILDFLYIDEPEEDIYEKRYNTLVEYAAREKLGYRQATRLLGKAYREYAEKRE
jgi:hypothetical protein